MKEKRGSMKRKLLIVEDDSDLNSTLVKFLTIKGFEVVSAFDGQEAVDNVYEHTFDLIVLDVKLPTLNGFEVAQEVRAFSATPIIFLTSLDAQKDVEKGFEQGGDDYMTKPFSLNELLFRIQAIFRRIYGNENIIDIDETCYFNAEKLTLYKENKIIALTDKEIKLLSMFLKQKEKTFTREEIFEVLYDYAEDPNEASLRVFINRLRKIIGKQKIKTVKNVGYAYVG